VVQPVCGGVMMIWFEPRKVNDPNRKTAYANGAFMLLRRDVYDRIGQHRALQSCLQEDMEFARRAKAMGSGPVIVRNKGLYVVRMYTSLRAILRGWTRIFFGCFTSLQRLILSLLAVVLLGLLPCVAMILGAILAVAGVAPMEGWLATGIVGAAVLGIQYSVILRYYKLIDAKTAYGWLYPLGALMAVLALLSAVAKHLPGAKLTWKGTTYAK
jgi:hypothetical protein